MTETCIDDGSTVEFKAIKQRTPSTAINSLGMSQRSVVPVSDLSLQLSPNSSKFFGSPYSISIDGWWFHWQPDKIFLFPRREETDPKLITAILIAADSIYGVLHPLLIELHRRDIKAMTLAQAYQAIGSLSEQVKLQEIATEFKNHPILENHQILLGVTIEQVVTALAISRALRLGQYPPKAGFVYLLQSPTGAYKIGRTKNPGNRIETFSVKLPFEVEFTHLLFVDDMAGVEAELHETFEHKRINGEWFTLDSEDIELFKRLEQL